jgi:crotonobetainyl-CoA:carnitine CoA-transferase CaiB-like acyl-CoA transferase
MEVALPHAGAGTVPLVANPLRLSASPVRYHMAPPDLGAHTRDVLGAVLGVSSRDIQALADSGAIQID